MCWISIRPTTNMTNHNNAATFREIRNSEKILSDLVSHRVSTVHGFWWNIIIVVTVLVYAVGGYWIITYVKKYGNTGVYIIKHISMFYLELRSEYIVKWISYMKMTGFFFFFFRCCKYIVGQLWHSSIWNFLMKNKEKNQAHEELTFAWNHKFLKNLHFKASKLKKSSVLIPNIWSSFSFKSLKVDKKSDPNLGGSSFFWPFGPHTHIKMKVKSVPPHTHRPARGRPVML